MMKHRLIVLFLVLGQLTAYAQSSSPLSELKQISDSLLQQELDYANHEDWEAAIKASTSRFEVLTEWRKLRDSLDLRALGDSLKLEERQAEIAYMQVQSSNQRRQIFWVIAMLFVVSLIIVVGRQSIKRRQRKEQELFDLEAQTQKLDITRNQILAEKEAMKSQELQQRYELKSQQLSGQFLQAIQQNKMLTKISQQLEQDTSLAGMQALLEQIKEDQPLDQDWQNFMVQFQELHPNFLSEIEQPDTPLTETEQRLAVLLRLQLSSKEIAPLLGLTPASVKTSRYRLARKIPLAPDQKLTDYLLQAG